MGFYIERTSKNKPLSTHSKADQLIADGARRVSGDKYIPRLVCVVENGMFDAAGWAFSDNERQDFAHEDGRRKQWLQLTPTQMLANFTMRTIQEAEDTGDLA